jgi:hypothetical protein
MLNCAKTILSAIALVAILGFYGWQESLISQQAPKSIQKNQGAAANQYEPGPFVLIRIFVPNGLEKISKYCNSYSEKEKKNWPQSYFCDLRITDVWIAIFSGLLVFVTLGLGWIGYQQRSDSKIVQRAYISINPAGINTNTFGQLIGHVVFENGGHLPADDFHWRIKINSTGKGDWVPQRLTSADLEGDAVLPVGAKWKMGSGACDPMPKERWEYVFVWGRVEYTDGFQKRRFTDFCHRYPWAKHVRGFMESGDFAIPISISVDDARFHKIGNNSN